MIHQLLLLKVGIVFLFALAFLLIVRRFKRNALIVIILDFPLHILLRNHILTYFHLFHQLVLDDLVLLDLLLLCHLNEHLLSRLGPLSDFPQSVNPFLV